MEELQYIQIEPGNHRQEADARRLWLPFVRELDLHEGEEETETEILDGLAKRIGIQGRRPDMHFEIAYRGEAPLAIAMFAIDLGTVYGLLPRGCGTVTGFYVAPEHRRQGVGAAFCRHIEDVLRRDGADQMYLTPDAVTGIPFWEAMGFTASGITDPDDRKEIYTKKLEPLR